MIWEENQLFKFANFTIDFNLPSLQSWISWDPMLSCEIFYVRGMLKLYMVVPTIKYHPLQKFHPFTMLKTQEEEKYMKDLIWL